MSISTQSGRAISYPSPAQPAWTVRRASRPRSVPAPRARLNRRFDTEWFDGTDVQYDTRVAPALPVFEEAFGAFTHGILIQTEHGPVAIEDLQPGTMIESASGRMLRLMWKGSITLVPGAPTLNEEPDRLYRVMPDAFGIGRPSQDQTFGPHARRLDRDPKVRASLGVDGALMPVSELVDGYGVITVNPVSPTRVYHLACEEHETILASGMEVETYHPGPDAPLSMSEEMMEIFMSFFPYLSSIRQFGRLTAPRVRPDEMAQI